MGDSQDEFYTAGGLYETEAQRLQREADKYTQELEFEKKRYLILEDQYKQSNAEYQENLKKIKDLIPSEEDNRKKEVNRRQVLHVYAHQLVRLNHTIGENRKLKTEIDIARQELVFARDSIKKMEAQIQELKDKITEASAESMNNFRIANESNNLILSLKSRHEISKEKFELEVKKLQERLKEKDEYIEFDEEQFDNKKKEEGGIQKGEAFSNPIAIMKLRVNKLTQTNLKKKRLVDQYVKNASIIEQAFQQIKENSGIQDVDEIVTTFIKAEEQNYSLFNFVNLLTQEIDALEDNNEYLDDEITKYQLLAEQNEAEKRRKIQELKNQRDELKESIGVAQSECENIQGEFNLIKGNVQKMVQMFQQARFQSNVADKQSYDEDTQFNENNICNYLAELEEYISNFITMIAYQNQDSNIPAAISSLPLDKLNPKEFNKKEIQIDAPIMVQRVTEMSGAQTEVGDESNNMDDDAFDAKTLYKNFMELVQSQRLNIVQQSQAKRDGMTSNLKSDDF